MKGLNHPNIGEEGKGVGSMDTNQGTWVKRVGGRETWLLQ